mmetsp:Transcript_17914/g.29960  ORF Transcript_17914/g.29960 Transcript_17914/m.29960 type:complete len:161 (+) Transcript_17914:57-539(+)
MTGLLHARGVALSRSIGERIVCRRLIQREFAITVLPMPKLSPTQTASGVTTKLIKWHVQNNMYLDAYSLICEVETDALTGDGSNAVHQLDIEIQEDCYVAKLLCHEGDSLQAGMPIAICCDEEDEVAVGQLDALVDIRSDAYLQAELPLAGFQCYTKTGR